MERWKAVTKRPATGRSFLIIILVAGIAALVVMIWTFRMASKTRRDGAAAATFRI